MFTRATPQRLRDKQLIIKRYTNEAYFTLIYLTIHARFPFVYQNRRNDAIVSITRVVTRPHPAATSLARSALPYHNSTAPVPSKAAGKCYEHGVVEFQTITSAITAYK